MLSWTKVLLFVGMIVMAGQNSFGQCDRATTVSWTQTLPNTLGSSTTLSASWLYNGSTTFISPNPGVSNFTSSNTSVASINGTTLTIVGRGTAVITATSPTRGYYCLSTATKTITVPKLAQTITWSQTLAGAYGYSPLTLNVTASSGLGITYVSNNTVVATISGNTLTIVGLGSVTITAQQAGNTDYNAATSIAKTFTVTKGTQSISWSQTLTGTYGTAPLTLNATASSGLGITYESSNTAVVTISENILTIVGLGTTTITAKQVGNSNYYAATDVAKSLTVTSGNQTINWSQMLTVAYYGDASITLNATASSGLEIVYESDNTDVATISGNTLSIVGVGTANITAKQVGNTNYNAATNVSKLLTVTKRDQSISWSQTLTNARYGDVSITLNATANSGLGITY
ncbi:hypothetical protein FACS1894201_00400 [Bacteroidia bacterium]|nr:hypothetical protein FACS1894201_00400 [Bacteroidia bacterium]